MGETGDVECLHEEVLGTEAQLVERLDALFEHAVHLLLVAAPGCSPLFEPESQVIEVVVHGELLVPLNNVQKQHVDDDLERRDGHLPQEVVHEILDKDTIQLGDHGLLVEHPQQGDEDDRVECGQRVVGVAEVLADRGLDHLHLGVLVKVDVLRLRLAIALVTIVFVAACYYLLFGLFIFLILVLLFFSGGRLLFVEIVGVCFETTVATPTLKVLLVGLRILHLLQMTGDLGTAASIVLADHLIKHAVTIITGVQRIIIISRAFIREVNLMLRAVFVCRFLGLFFLLLLLFFCRGSRSLSWYVVFWQVFVLCKEHVHESLLDVELAQRLYLLHEYIKEHGLVETLEDEDAVLNEERVQEIEEVVGTERDQANDDTDACVDGSHEHRLVHHGHEYLFDDDLHDLEARNREPNLQTEDL